MPENMKDQVDGRDGGGARGELQRLLEDLVAHCAAAGAGVLGNDVGRPGDEDSPAAVTEIDVMTIFPSW